MTRGGCIKEEFSSDIRFWIEEGFSVEAVFIREMRTSDEEIVERGFSNKGIPGKKALWDKKSASDSTSLFF